MKQNTQRLLDTAIFEVLEDRRLMSASPIAPPSLQSGVLTINNSNPTSARVMVSAGAKAGTLNVDVQGQHSVFASSQVKKFIINTAAGNDYVYIDPGIDIPAYVTSGSGNDTIRAGGGGDTIVVGNGNDLIYGKGGNNVYEAGDGNDTIYGGNGNESFTVGNGNDLLVGGGGTDKMLAGSGNDTFLVGNGHDTITTGTGHDKLVGGRSNTYLYGKNTGTTTTTTGSSSGSSSGTTSTGSTTTKTTTSGTNTNGTTTGSGASTNSSSGTSSTSTSGSSSSSGGSSTSSGSTTSGSSTTTTSGTTTTTTSGSSSSGSTAGTGSGKATGQNVPTISNTNNLLVSNSNAAAPTPDIVTMDGTRQTGLVVNVDGMTSKLGMGTNITTNYAWDFGDPGSANNQMTGFNGAHVYDQTGTYTIKLTVTDEDGKSASTTTQVTVTASTRKQIYVDSTGGSDSNSGSINSPLQSMQAAFAKLGNNTEILLKAGDTFTNNETMHVNYSNVLIGRYGTGANPMVMRLEANGVSTIGSYGNTNGLTIQDITFNSPYSSTDPRAHKIAVSGIYLGGQNCCVRDCTFLNLDDAINENGNPVGVLIQNNSAPQAIGLRGYMVWGQGAQQVIIGNYAAGTTQEHIVRLVGVNEVTVEGNNFTNHDGKGCIEMHRGQNAWIVDNAVTGGDIRLGPLGLWGEPTTSATEWCVIEDNELTDTMIYLQPGSHHAMIANNVIDNSSGQAIAIVSPDSEGRTSADITIIHNTGIDTGTQGNFLNVWGWVNGIVMQDNLFIAPNLQIGVSGTAPVRVYGNNLGAFTSISGNVWPDLDTTGTFAAGGINFVGQSSSSTSYQSASEWDAMSPVKNDQFQNVKLNGSYEMTIGSQSVGASIQIAA